MIMGISAAVYLQPNIGHKALTKGCKTETYATDKSQNRLKYPDGFSYHIMDNLNPRNKKRKATGKKKMWLSPKTA